MEITITTLAKRDFTESAISLGIWEHLKEMARKEEKRKINDNEEITIHISRAYI